MLPKDSEDTWQPVGTGIRNMQQTPCYFNDIPHVVVKQKAITTNPVSETDE
ncbi:MAG: hypothetical protein ACRC7H_01395 [Plesiomonas shigelloides]